MQEVTMISNSAEEVTKMAKYLIAMEFDKIDITKFSLHGTKDIGIPDGSENDHD